MSITILPRFVGELITVAHRAIVHACTIDDEVLIGMGAITLDGAEIGGPGVTSKSQNISANSTRPVAALYERRIF
jgi:carbonic anhydrase/acetyltransferase-like protein (isoleucine patch superfamily)